MMEWLNECVCRPVYVNIASHFMGPIIAVAVMTVLNRRRAR